MVEAIETSDIPDVAAFFSIQKRSGDTAQRQLSNKPNVELGKQIFQTGIKGRNIPACIYCHGTTGEGKTAETYPALSAQHASYTSKALRDFRNSTRKNDPNSLMRDIASKLSDKEINALSSYIEHLIVDGSD